jgi:CelD/BcsL family acetyltransferase involved in cellulose biosynthesis
MPERLETIKLQSSPLADVPGDVLAATGTGDGAAAAMVQVLRWRTQLLAQRSLGAYAADWDALLQRLWGNHPMLASAFIDTLLRHFGTGRERLCVGRDADGVQAMAVLVPAGSGVWRTFMPSQLQIAPVLIRDAAPLQALMRALPQPCWRLELLCHDERLFRCVPVSARRPGMQWHALTTFIALQGSFGEYLRQRPKNLRANLRRYEARLQKYGESQFVTVTNPAELPAAVARYAEIESRGWKGRAGTAVQDSNGQRLFYTDLLVALSRHGGAEVHELHLNGQLIASRLVVTDDKLVVILKTTYLERFADCSPGNLLLSRVVERAFKHHAGKRIEFCTNANPDQQAWATGTQDIVNVEYCRWNWLGAGVEAARNAVAWRRRSAAPAALYVRTMAPTDELPQEVLRLLQHAGLALAQSSRLHLLYQGVQALAVLPSADALDPETGTPVLLPPLLAYRVEGAMLAPLVQAVMAQHAAGLGSVPMDPGSRSFSALRDGCRAAGLSVFTRPVAGTAAEGASTGLRWRLVAFNPDTQAGRRALWRELVSGPHGAGGKAVQP